MARAHLETLIEQITGIDKAVPDEDGKDQGNSPVAPLTPGYI